MSAPEIGQFACKIKAFPIDARPVEPGHRIVLGIGIVVALWVRPNSSPAVSMMVPRGKQRRQHATVAAAGGRDRRGSALAPEFHDKFSSWPSRFARHWPRCACAGRDTSASVKPSCAAMKLTCASRLAWRPKMSDEPASRVASAPTCRRRRARSAGHRRGSGRSIRRKGGGKLPSW